MPDRTDALYELDLGGRWVNLDIRGRRRCVGVHVGDAATDLTQVAWLIVGMPYRCWIPDSASELVLKGGSTVELRIELNKEMQVISADIGDG